MSIDYLPDDFPTPTDITTSRPTKAVNQPGSFLGMVQTSQFKSKNATMDPIKTPNSSHSWNERRRGLLVEIAILSSGLVVGAFWLIAATLSWVSFDFAFNVCVFSAMVAMLANSANNLIQEASDATR